MAGTTLDPLFDGEYTRPFGPDAPWNIPVSYLDTDPNSDYLANLLWNDSFTDRPDRNFNLNNTSYTYPVYEVTADTPYFRVNDKNGWGNLGGEYIPFDPSWKPAPGSDGQIIILDPATGREWDLWQVSFDGEAVNISNGNLVSGLGGSDSYFDREVGFEPSRGAGIQYLAMLVRPEEVAQGKIEHALSMPIQNTSGSAFVSPATKIEFQGVRPDGIPEGTRFALDVTYKQIDQHLASLPDDIPQVTIDSLRVIMVALKEYGWFITDTAGSTHFQLESTTSAMEEWAALGMVDSDYGWGVYPRDALDGLLTEERIVAIAPSDLYPDYNPDNEGLGSGHVDLPVDATIGAVIPENIYGGRANDVLTGSHADERMFGRGGNDKIVALGGDDRLAGGNGRDRLIGGSGDDQLGGARGKDKLFGGDGADQLGGGLGHDRLNGGPGGDRLIGARGNDKLFGGNGVDRLAGGPGRDALFGGPGNDRIHGDAGNDFVSGGRGDDFLRGGDGMDRFMFKSGWGVDRILDVDAVGLRHDTIDIRALHSVDNWGDLVANHMYQDGHDVVIDGGNGDMLILTGVDLSTLDATDFLI